MSFNLAELRLIRRAFDTFSSPALNNKTMAAFAALSRKVDKLIRAANKAIRDPDVDRKPGLLCEYTGRVSSYSAQAPEDLLEAFDAQCEELGTNRSAMIRELMVKAIKDRRDFKAVKAKAVQGVGR